MSPLTLLLDLLLYRAITSPGDIVQVEAAIAQEKLRRNR